MPSPVWSTSPPRRPPGRRAIVALAATVLAVLALVATGCSGSEGGDGGEADGTAGTSDEGLDRSGLGPGGTYPPISMADLDRQVRDRSAELSLEGATLLVHQDGQRLHELTVGAVLPVSSVPLAETGTWLATVTLMSLVEDGLVGLDEPVGQQLPWLTGEARTVTLRQLLSHTSGLPREISCATVEACDAALATIELDDEPGDDLALSPAGYHLAARLAETATGQPWDAIVAERVLTPLAMAQTSFRAPPATAADEAAAPPSIDVAPGLLAADGTTTAEDVGRFLAMVLAKGEVPGAPGVRVLEATSVEEVERDQTPRIDTSDEPWVAATGVPTYGLGVWRDRLRGDGTGLASMVSAPNQLGLYPLVDRARGAWAVLVLVDVRADPLDAVEDSARVAMLVPPAIDTTGRPPGAPPLTTPTVPPEPPAGVTTEPSEPPPPL